ncbi:unnamed protein product, partial [Nesidiocoris tenuis]
SKNFVFIVKNLKIRAFVRNQKLKVFQKKKQKWFRRRAAEKITSTRRARENENLFIHFIIRRTSRDKNKQEVPKWRRQSRRRRRRAEIRIHRSSPLIEKGRKLCQNRGEGKNPFLGLTGGREVNYQGKRSNCSTSATRLRRIREKTILAILAFSPNRDFIVEERVFAHLSHYLIQPIAPCESLLERFLTIQISNLDQSQNEFENIICRHFCTEKLKTIKPLCHPCFGLCLLFQYFHPQKKFTLTSRFSRSGVLRVACALPFSPPSLSVPILDFRTITILPFTLRARAAEVHGTDPERKWGYSSCHSSKYFSYVSRRGTCRGVADFFNSKRSE